MCGWLALMLQLYCIVGLLKVTIISRYIILAQFSELLNFKPANANTRTHKVRGLSMYGVSYLLQRPLFVHIALFARSNTKTVFQETLKLIPSKSDICPIPYILSP